MANRSSEYLLTIEFQDRPCLTYELIDRDSALVSHIFDERNPAVMTMVKMAIATVKANGRKIGICGQAPSDYPEFARFLVEQGIDSISLNPDSVIKTRLEIARVEASL